MQSIIHADPFKCRVWHLHQRLAGEIDEQTCKAEIESFAAHGQRVPVMGRRLQNDPDYEIELAYGARRLFAARHLNLPLLVEVREFTDREGLIAMDIENRQRQDISPYERGLSYRRWLQSGHFKSPKEISETLKVSAPQVSRLLQLARLPAVVVNAFRGPIEIRESWGLKLIELLDDPQRCAATIRSARSLGNKSPRLQGSDVMRKLLAFSVRGRKPKREPHDKVVLGSDGSAVFRIRYLNNAIALIFEAEKISERSLSRIEKVLGAILHGTGAHPSASTREQRSDALPVRPRAALDNDRRLTL